MNKTLSEIINDEAIHLVSCLRCAQRLKNEYKEEFCVYLTQIKLADEGLSSMWFNSRHFVVGVN